MKTYCSTAHNQNITFRSSASVFGSKGYFQIFKRKYWVLLAFWANKVFKDIKKQFAALVLLRILENILNFLI